MKQVLFILLALSFSFIVNAQTIKEYKASNGIVYHVGDTITFGRGAGTNGRFTYVQMGNAFMMGAAAEQGVGKNWSGFNAIIKKIKQITVKGATRTCFTVGTGGPARFSVMIEDALEVDEVVNPNKKEVKATKESDSNDKIKKLKELKELLDSGTLTQEEFDAEKKKVLE